MPPGCRRCAPKCAAWRESPTERMCRSARVWGSVGTYRAWGHQRNRGVTSSRHPRRHRAENECGPVFGGEVPPEAGQEDGPGGPTRWKPRLPAKGAAACPGHPVLGRHRHSRSEDRDTLPDEVHMGPADARPSGPPSTHSSARRSGATAPRRARALHLVRTRPSPALGGLQCGAQRPSEQARAPHYDHVPPGIHLDPQRTGVGEPPAEGKGCAHQDPRPGR